jgi:hypothetical protein
LLAAKKLVEAKKLVVEDLLTKISDAKMIKREAKDTGNLSLAEEARLLIRSLQKKYKKALEEAELAELALSEEEELEREIERVKFLKKSKKTLEKEESIEIKRLRKKALREKKALVKKMEKQRAQHLASIKRQKREDKLDEAR